MRELFFEFIESIGGLKTFIKLVILAVLFNIGIIIETVTGLDMLGTLYLWFSIFTIYRIINKNIDTSDIWKD